MSAVTDKLKLQIQTSCEKKLNAIVTDTILGVATDCVEFSPVGEYHKWSKKYQRMAGEYGTDYIEGHYVLNWRFKKNNDHIEISDRGQNPKPKAADTLLMDVAKERHNFSKGGRWVLYNNSSYAMDLEEGWSGQAPLGVASLAIMNAPQHLKEAIHYNK